MLAHAQGGETPGAKISAHNVLENTRQGENQTRSDTDKEDSSNLAPPASRSVKILASTTAKKELSPPHVQSKRHTGVGKQRKGADTPESVEWLETLGERDDAGVDASADRSVVVKRHDRVHLSPVNATCQWSTATGGCANENAP